MITPPAPLEKFCGLSSGYLSPVTGTCFKSYWYPRGSWYEAFAFCQGLVKNLSGVRARLAHMPSIDIVNDLTANPASCPMLLLANKKVWTGLKKVAGTCTAQNDQCRAWMELDGPVPHASSCIDETLSPHGNQNLDQVNWQYWSITNDASSECLMLRYNGEWVDRPCRHSWAPFCEFLVGMSLHLYCSNQDSTPLTVKFIILKRAILSFCLILQIIHTSSEFINFLGVHASWHSLESVPDSA